MLKKYKKETFVIIFAFTLIGFFIQYMVNAFTWSSFSSVLMSFLFCLYAWFNGTFTAALPIDEESSNGEVIRRGVMIATGVIVHLYMIFSPLL